MTKKPTPLKSIIRQLSSVEPAIREKALAKLIKRQQPIPESEFPSLSLGLYYFFWYCDKSKKELLFLKNLTKIIKSLIIISPEELSGNLKNNSSGNQMNTKNSRFPYQNNQKQILSNGNTQKELEKNGNAIKYDLKKLSKFIQSFLNISGKKFARIDIHRVNKFLMLFRHFFFFIFGLDFSDLVLNPECQEPPTQLEFFDQLWGSESKLNLRLLMTPIRSELMGSYDREGLLLEFTRSVNKILPRLQQYSVFSDISRLFLFCKPLFDLLAFTGDKRLRMILKEEFLEALLKVLENHGVNQRKKFGKFVMVYAKSPSLKVINRSILYDYIESIEKIKSNGQEISGPTPPPKKGIYKSFVLIFRLNYLFFEKQI